jgi:hypothetical protein
MDQVELWTFLLFDWLTSGSSRSGNKETAPIYRRVGGGESPTLHSPSSKRHGWNRSPGRASSSSIIIIREDAEKIRMRLITWESTRKVESSWRDGS